MIQRQYIRLAILAIIVLLVIGYILWRTDHMMHEVDRQMPTIGCILFSLS